MMNQEEGLSEYYRTFDRFVVFYTTPNNERVEIGRFQDENHVLKLITQLNLIEMRSHPDYRNEYDYYNLNDL